MKRSYIPALIVAMIVAGWLASGQFNQDSDTNVLAPTLSEQNARRLAAAEDNVVSVRAKIVTASLQTPTVNIRGRTEFSFRVDVRTETQGKVVERLVVRGARVKAGDLLCRISTSDREVKLWEAQAALRQAQLEYNGALKLDKSGLQSDIGMAAAKTRLVTMQAQLKRRQLNLAHTRLRAPFDGIVEHLPAPIGAYLKVGGICASIVDLDPILMVGRVSERDIEHVKLGRAATATLLNGETIEGVVTFVSKDASVQTRTYEIEITVPNPDNAIASGLTLNINIPTESYQAHRISPALLTLDDAGNIGVRIIDENNRVLFQPVDIIKDASSGVWVSGLPRVTKIITVGQELVVEGDLVSVSMQPGGSAPTLEPKGQTHVAEPSASRDARAKL